MPLGERTLTGMSDAEPLSPTERTRIRRARPRARRDRADLHALLDAGLVCHLGFLTDGFPRVLPTGYGRIDDTLYLHGSAGARSLRDSPGTEVCATVTHLDGIVYARSLFHHSANYRCAVIHGLARHVTTTGEKTRALRAISEQLAPGSWDRARRPDERELAATAVLALPLREASVKVRDGGANDDETDIARGDTWAGVLPLHTSWGRPVPATDLPADTRAPAEITARPDPG